MSEEGTDVLLTRAAGVAGRFAHQFGRRVNVKIHPDRIEAADDVTAAAIGLLSDRILASQPDHWQAVAAMFSALLVLHPATTGDSGLTVCATCVNLGEPDLWPCSTLHAVRPLAEQILQHISQAPAPAASSPASQAATGTVADPSSAAVPVAREGVPVLSCGALAGRVHEAHEWRWRDTVIPPDITGETTPYRFCPGFADIDGAS